MHQTIKIYIKIKLISNLGFTNPTICLIIINVVNNYKSIQIERTKQKEGIIDVRGVEKQIWRYNKWANPMSYG